MEDGDWRLILFSCINATLASTGGGRRTRDGKMGSNLSLKIFSFGEFSGSTKLVEGTTSSSARRTFSGHRYCMKINNLCAVYYLIKIILFLLLLRSGLSTNDAASATTLNFTNQANLKLVQSFSNV